MSNTDVAKARDMLVDVAQSIHGVNGVSGKYYNSSDFKNLCGYVTDLECVLAQMLIEKYSTPKS